MGMNFGEEIYWVVTCAVRPDQLAEFKTIAGQLVAAAREEAGTLAYEFAIDADQSTIHIFERYRDLMLSYRMSRRHSGHTRSAF